MPLDCLLIHPGAQQIIYGDLSARETAIEPPTWARMIAGWLRDRGYQIDIVDQDGEGLSPAQVAARVEIADPRLVAIVVSGHQPSASTQQMTGASEVAKAIQGLAPTIMVGNHPSALPERTLEEEAVDHVCDGEGPLTIAGLLEVMSTEPPWPEIPGLVFQLSGGTNSSAPAPLIPVDELHGDVWDLLPMHRYRAHTWQCLDGSPRQPYASIYTTLGCPFKCNFCMINTIFHANKYRRRDPVKVVEQIADLYWNYGVRTLKIADEMFVLNENHYMAICTGLSRLSVVDDLNIWAYARIDTIKPHTLALLRSAGIRWLALGIESGSAYVRDGAEKHLTDEDIRESVKAIQAAGINVIGNFIFGLPDDTRASMWATLMLAESLDLEFANFYSAMAYPGSQLFEQAKPEDLPGSWSGYSQHSHDCRPLPTATLSSADVLAFRDAAFEHFFEDERYLETVDKKFGAAGLAEIKRMLLRKMPRELLAA